MLQALKDHPVFSLIGAIGAIAGIIIGILSLNRAKIRICYRWQYLWIFRNNRNYQASLVERM